MKQYIALVAFGLGIFSFAQHGPRHDQHHGPHSQLKHVQPPHQPVHTIHGPKHGYIKSHYPKGPKFQDRRDAPREMVTVHTSRKSKPSVLANVGINVVIR